MLETIRFVVIARKIFRQLLLWVSICVVCVVGVVWGAAFAMQLLLYILLVLVGYLLFGSLRR